MDLIVIVVYQMVMPSAPVKKTKLAHLQTVGRNVLSVLSVLKTRLASINIAKILALEPVVFMPSVKSSITILSVVVLHISLEILSSDALKMVSNAKQYS